LRHIFAIYIAVGWN